MTYAEMYFTREVLCRMIEVAYADMRAVPGNFKDPYKAREVGIDRADAEKWLTGAGDSPLPFECLCDALGFDANIIRERSMKK